jgi:hypothetical protein
MLPIARQGCTYLSALVVTGPARGRIASIDLDLRPPKFCADTGFLAWYERWLDEIASGYAMDWYGMAPPGDDEAHIAVLYGDAPPAARTGAIRALHRQPAYTGQVRAALARAAADDSSDVRKAAVAALAKRPDPVTEQLLQAALGDPAAGVRSAALHALDRRGCSWCPAAITLLSDDPAASVRMDALLVLDHSGALTEDAIIGRASDPDAAIRRQAQWLLSQRQSPRTAEIIRPMLNDPDPSIRLGALHALHRAGILTGADAAGLSADPDELVRSAAERTLTRPNRRP